MEGKYGHGCTRATHITKVFDSDIIIVQARSKPILIGQAVLHMSSRGVWGHAPPEEFLKSTHREMQSGAFWRMSDKILFQNT